MRKVLLLILGISTYVNSLAQHVSPNIVLIYIDDMGYGDTEPFGMTGIPTPTFNLLAKQGTRFTHFNAAQPICTASRAALLTGCYPNRISMAGVLVPNDARALNPEETTIAAMLKKSGYNTAAIGKWHLGDRAPYLPLGYGFDEYYGLPYSNDMWNRDDFGNLVTDKKSIHYTWPSLPLIEGNKMIDSITTMEQQSELTANYTQKATSFIRRNKNKPFFLYLAHSMVHVPIAAGKKFKGKSGDMGTFGDVIMEIDWSVSEILKTLKEENLDQNTLVIVTSDNGPWLNYGDHAGSSGGLREGKATSFEGGTRVSMYMRWPGKIGAGDVNSSLMVNIDLLPTIAAATGAALPEKKIDGINFLPFITGNTQKPPREVFYYYYGRNSLEGVRYKNWKLVLPHKSAVYTTTTHGKGGAGGPMPWVQIPMALYDIAHDPGEAYDTQKLYPEMVEKLLALAADARNDLGDDLKGIEGKNVRKAAKTK